MSSFRSLLQHHTAFVLFNMTSIFQTAYHFFFVNSACSFFPIKPGSFFAVLFGKLAHNAKLDTSFCNYIFKFAFCLRRYIGKPGVDISLNDTKIPESVNAVFPRFKTGGILRIPMLNRISEFKYKIAIFSRGLLPKQVIKIVENNMRCVYAHRIAVFIASIEEVFLDRINGDALRNFIISFQITVVIQCIAFGEV